MYENTNRRIICRLDSAFARKQTSPVQMPVEIVGLSQSEDKTELQS